ncbi:MAG: hypothetical protein QOJ16_3394 [Acidobacteriota bacterium]|jgi:hypothetical protein|nr:hypothetical protein [Acidobacteriota bacterium]
MAASPEAASGKELLMFSSQLRRLAPFALTLALAAPLSAAAPHASSRAPKGAQPAAAPASLLSTWTDWLLHLWAAEGCIIDPDGRCRTAPRADAGCIIDPDGRCRTAPRTDAGCILDPGGRCLSGQ